jgi:Carbohydrate binding module (family 35)
VDIPDGFVSEINAISGQLPSGKAIGFNTVDGYGGDQVAAKSYLDTQHTESGGIPTAVVGYMNYYNDDGPDDEAENAVLGGNCSVNNSFTVPRLQNWDMIYVDRTFTTPANNQYEAENAVLTNVGTASDHAGYTGTGFVDKFDLATSGVSFTVNAATAGNYSMVLRYGNGGSTASRTIAVDGNQVATPTFTSLGTWEAWSTVTVPVTLSAGSHTVVAWDSDGTSGAIKLDNLTLGRS